MIEKLLQSAIKNNVSDIHITSNDYVAVRINKQVSKVKIQPSEDEVIALTKQICGDRYDLFLRDKQMDLSGEIDGVRFRANIYYERGTIAIAMRVINNQIKSIIELNLPIILTELIRKPHGLILVTGPTGSGKSTTLAAMLNEINQFFQKHIITIEDPIEYVFTNKKSIVHQREIGRDLHSFDDGLRSILRQDPDVIMIGELRDRNTIKTALKASETGHLVLSTLHTNDVKSTINRITGVFHSDEEQSIRHLLSESLIAIISQQLIPTMDGKGVVPAFEIMINHTPTANIIRNDEVGQLDSYLLMDQKIGSIPMSKSIDNLIKARKIRLEDVS